MILEPPPIADLASALDEVARLRAENSRLRQLLEYSGRPALDSGGKPEPRPSDPPVGGVTKDSTVEQKIALFRRLFRGRDDVYAVRWERPDGRHGYAPARAYGGSSDADRPHLPVSDEVIRDHLRGRRVVGVYPLLREETCWFLAADFDKAGWRKDATTYMTAAAEYGIATSIERSRSGDGAHVWIFFTKPVQAAQARRLGCALITRALASRHQLGMDSYDRLFPNQDTIPKGGFGNLIALPLHGRARLAENTVFLDARTLHPADDQWSLLSTSVRVEPADVDRVVRDALRSGRLISIPSTQTDGDGSDDPWITPSVLRRREAAITEPLPATTRLVLANLVFVAKAGLPSPLLHRIARLAAFQNPEFYSAQSMRLSTFGKPRIIDCSEDLPDHLTIPRGCLDAVLELLRQHGIWPEIEDRRHDGERLDVAFHGTLHADQRRATGAIAAHDTGVLCAPTAFGKTVVGASIIARRGVNALVLVHRQHLLDQWRERLSAFLDIPLLEIGQIGGGRHRPNGRLDVALLQSVVRKGEVWDGVLAYGHVIVDECHHIPAFSFERVLRGTKARFILGLTATPLRKDGHHPIVVMQCGPVRHRVDAKEHASRRGFDHRVVPHVTGFHVAGIDAAPSIQDIYRQIASDDPRTERICCDVAAAVRSGRSPLVLTERTDHLDRLVTTLCRHVSNVVVLRGGMGVRQRRTALQTLTTSGDDAERVIVATGRYIGEGFDDARLDTLFLAMPVAWKGTIQQYAGRLHRDHIGKELVLIHDYVDARVPVLARMFEKRLRGYRAIGYVVDEPVSLSQCTDVP